MARSRTSCISGPPVRSSSFRRTIGPNRPKAELRTGLCNRRAASGKRRTLFLVRAMPSLPFSCALYPSPFVRPGISRVPETPHRVRHPHRHTFRQIGRITPGPDCVMSSGAISIAYLLRLAAGSSVCDLGLWNPIQNAPSDRPPVNPSRIKSN